MSAKFVKSMVALGAMLALSTGYAAPVTFFGQDINNAGDPEELAAHTNADLARSSFFSNLVGVGTETFESIAAGSASPTVSFAGAGSATLAGGNVRTGSDGAGRYPISGSKYYYAGTSNFTINFSQAVSAFGFYGIDIGDFGGQLTLTLTNGGTQTVTVPNQISSTGQISGSVLYFGLYDTVNSFTAITFGNNSGGNDVFAFDDFSVGSLQQIKPLPEPATLALVGSSLAALAFLRRRRA